MSKKVKHQTPAFTNFPEMRKRKMKGEQVRKMMMNRVDSKESSRLGSSGIVNTYHFRQSQSFGSASKVRHIDPKEYENYLGDGKWKNG